ncbi:hypothetical protein pb186bvf_018822 [Paramecium bursaria]
MKRQNSVSKTSPCRYFSPTKDNYREIMRQITQNDANRPIKKANIKTSPSNYPKLKQKTKSKPKCLRSSQVSVTSKIDQFQIIDMIGHGKFGKVFKCQHHQTKKLYAIKMINKRKIQQQNFSHQLEREVKIQQKLNHPNIIKLYDFFETNEDYCLLLEYANGGSLFQSLIKTNQKRYSEPQASMIIKQVALAISYLQYNNIIHRDLKPENILWNDGVIKLSDFGWSIQNTTERETLCGTIDYLSPEMVQGQAYDQSVDVWSLGVLIFELTTGKTPFQIHEGFKLTFPDHLSSDVKDLMKGLLQEKANRKSLEWALNHVWLC